MIDVRPTALLLLLTQTLALTLYFDLDLDFQSLASYCHDPYLQKSKSKTRLVQKIERKRTDEHVKFYPRDAMHIGSSQRIVNLARQR